MTKLVPDVERIKYERCKAMLFNIAALGIIMFGGAAYSIYRHGWNGDLFPIISALSGLGVFGLRHFLKRRWREALMWKSKQR